MALIKSVGGLRLGFLDIIDEMGDKLVSAKKGLEEIDDGLSFDPNKSKMNLVVTSYVNGFG
jgi:hypothetical protein